MALHSDPEFVELFRGLSRTEQRRFVAAVWAARGWEVAVADDAVVARDGEAVRRIRLVRPGWFGSPDLGDADVVVVTSDRDAVRSAASAAGVRYVSLADLREMLLYGVDRAEASALFGSFFDRPLTAPGTTSSASAASTPAVPIAAPGSAAMASAMRRLASVPPTTVLVAVLVVVAGVAAVSPSLFSLEPSTNAAAAGPNATYTPGTTGALGGDDGESAPVGLPPGVSNDGVANASALADAHLSQTTGHRYAFSFDFAGPAAAPDFEEWTAVEWNLVVENPRAFRVDAAFNGSDDWRTVRVYANGVRDYRIYATSESTRTSDMPAGASDADTYAHFAAGLVERYMNATNSSTDCVERRDGRCRLYRVTAFGGAPTLSQEVEGDGEIRDYQAVALVRSDGFVTELRVQYDLVTAGFTEVVDARFFYSDYGTARIEAPDWLSTFRDDGPNDTATASAPGENETATATAASNETAATTETATPSATTVATETAPSDATAAATEAATSA